MEPAFFSEIFAVIKSSALIGRKQMSLTNLFGLSTTASYV